MPPSSPTCNSEKVYAFTVSLTVYSLLKKKTAKGRASTSKEEKSVKSKELQVSIDDSNYLDFLQSMLDKHGQDQYNVSEKKRFPFKYVSPNLKTKSQHSSNAMDINNEAAYKEMVKYRKG